MPLNYLKMTNYTLKNWIKYNKLEMYILYNKLLRLWNIFIICDMNIIIYQKKIEKILVYS